MNEHKKDHPSFFDDRNIDKYYKSHIKTLNKQVLELESVGYEIYNVTHSNIDILNVREIQVNNFVSLEKRIPKNRDRCFIWWKNS